MSASTACGYYSVSIIKKQVMAVTGLLLCGFLVSHLAGNCLIYIGPKAFNTYAHVLITHPLIYVAEVILGLIFIGHVTLAVWVELENYYARPVKYHMKKHTGRGSTFASSTMKYTGLIILVFLIIHIKSFKFGTYYSATYDGVEMRDLYKLLLEYFSDPINVLWYIFSMLALGLHVSHGFWSAFQTLGVNHPRYNHPLRCFSFFFAVAISLGYIALPIYCYLQGAR